MQSPSPQSPPLCRTPPSRPLGSLRPLRPLRPLAARPGPAPGRHPQIPPPPWQRAPERPARRRRDPISRDAIVTAAVQLLDREGLAALSMRKLADELGAGAASLYWHVGSKDGLLDLVMDEVIGEGNVPDPDPARWREQLKQVARDQRAASLRHPWIVRVSIGRIPMGPNALRYSERILAILQRRRPPPAPGRPGVFASDRYRQRLHHRRDRRRRRPRPRRQRPAHRSG